MNNKRTLVIGASTNPVRYSNMAIKSLQNHNHEVVALAKREGKVGETQIQTTFPNKSIHTITLYLGPQRQPEYYKQIVDLNPERVIFNPGTENDELSNLLEENGIESYEACTLVMLNTGQY